MRKYRPENDKISFPIFNLKGMGSCSALICWISIRIDLIRKCSHCFTYAKVWLDFDADFELGKNQQEIEQISTWVVENFAFPSIEFQSQFLVKRLIIRFPDCSWPKLNQISTLLLKWTKLARIWLDLTSMLDRILSIVISELIFLFTFLLVGNLN